MISFVPELQNGDSDGEGESFIQINSQMQLSSEYKNPDHPISFHVLQNSIPQIVGFIATGGGY